MALMSYVEELSSVIWLYRFFTRVMAPVRADLLFLKPLNSSSVGGLGSVMDNEKEKINTMVDELVLQ